MEFPQNSSVNKSVRDVIGVQALGIKHVKAKERRYVDRNDVH